MKKIKIFSAIVFCVAILIISCSKNPGATGESEPPNTVSCDMVNAKFGADILPIIQTQCAINSGCHGAGSFNGPGELTGFTQIKNAAGSIKAAVVSGRMPLGGSLSSTQIRQISCWVDNGAVNN